MKDSNPKELAFGIATIFGAIATVFTITAVLVPDTDIFTAFCVLFWVFCCLCAGISSGVPKNPHKSKKIYPIEVV